MIGGEGIEQNEEKNQGEKRLMVECLTEMGSDFTLTLKALVDTGAEVNVIQKGLIP